MERFAGLFQSGPHHVMFCEMVCTIKGIKTLFPSSAG